MLDTYESISKDDEDWMAILSGQSVPDADPNTIREAQVLRMVLLVRAEEEKAAEFAKTDDQQWQRLENKLIKEGHIRPESLVKKLLKFLVSTIVNTSNQVTEFLTWQQLSLATAYTVLVSVVTLTLFHPADPLQIQSKSVGPNEGHDQKQTRLSLYRVIPHPVTDPQQSVLELQAKFIAKGTAKKDVTVFKNESDHQQWIVAIQIANNPPSRELRELYKTYQIDSEQNRWVYFIVKPE